MESYLITSLCSSGILLLEELRKLLAVLNALLLHSLDSHSVTAAIRTVRNHSRHNIVIIFCCVCVYFYCCAVASTAVDSTADGDGCMCPNGYFSQALHTLD